MGLSYPGLNSDVKAYLWKSICCPTLAYGMESIMLSQKELKELKTAQCNIIKRVMGINKRSHHTHLLKALGIPPVEEVIKSNCIRLYNNSLKTNTPARDLHSVLLAKYILNENVIKSTLLYRVVKSEFDPLKIIFDN